MNKWEDKRTLREKIKILAENEYNSPKAIEASELYKQKQNEKEEQKKFEKRQNRLRYLKKSIPEHKDSVWSCCVRHVDGICQHTEKMENTRLRFIRSMEKELQELDNEK